MSDILHRDSETDLSEQVARLEERVARLEELLSPDLSSNEATHFAGSSLAPQALPEHPPQQQRMAEDLEYEVGQNWFAKVGIVALTAGAAFALSLPFDNLPPAIPSVGGCVAVLILFVFSHLWRNSFDLVSRYFRGAAMALLYVSTLRLYFFSDHHLLTVDSELGKALLGLVVVLNLAIAYYRRSPSLLGLVLCMGYATAVAVNTSWFVLMTILALAAVAVHARIKFDSPAVLILATGLTCCTYFNWAANNPFFSHEYRLRSDNYPSLFVLLACIAVLAIGGILRRNREREESVTVLSSSMNCFLGYGVFFLHSLVFPTHFPTAQIIASITFIAVAAIFWIRERSESSTFLYAMTGYMALSAAIVKASASPEVFVWLSLQSLVVVSTAVWFQSRFIVVANFLIYVGIGAAYVAVARRESGISLILGVVALISARILNWKKERLLLKTELMRNAYLFSAFVIFPYALFHLVPGAYVALAWVGVALFYYAMNLIVRNPKYRWLGHATLMLTALYSFIAGISHFEPIYRIVSFFVVGSVLLIVSVVFTRIRKRGEEKSAVAHRQSVEG